MDAKHITLAVVFPGLKRSWRLARQKLKLHSAFDSVYPQGSRYITTGLYCSLEGRATFICVLLYETHGTLLVPFGLAELMRIAASQSELSAGWAKKTWLLVKKLSLRIP